LTISTAKPPKAIRPEATGLLIEEAQRLVAATRDDRFGPLWQFDLAVALRRDEIIQLRWSDIDLAARKMIIRASATYAFGEVTVKRPKNGRIRSVELSDLAIAALRMAKVEKAKDELRARDAYLDEGYVFADPLGRRLHPKNVTSAFMRTAKRLQLSTQRFHALRHTAASWMIASGIDVRTVASVLGHANANITLTVYAHLVEGQQANAVATIEQRLSGGSLSAQQDEEAT
jgi:integrase